MQVGFFDELLGQQSVTALCKNDKISLDYFTGQKVRLAIALFVETLVGELDTADKARVLIKNNIGCGKSTKNLDTYLFCNPAEPFGQFADRYRIVPQVYHLAET